MTRRYPDLPGKVLRRDSEIAKKVIKAWDVEHDHEKLLQIFLKESKNLSDERYWELLRTVWVLCGHLSNVDLFRKLMQSTRPQKFYFSSPEDAKALRELPDPFEVFRACNENDNGISWTTSKEYAEEYKQMYEKEKVLSMMVYKKHVFAYIRRNLEDEILIIS